MLVDHWYELRLFHETFLNLIYIFLMRNNSLDLRCDLQLARFTIDQVKARLTECYNLAFGTPTLWWCALAE